MSDTKKLDFKDYGIAFAMLAVLCSLAGAGRYKIAGSGGGERQSSSSRSYNLVAPDKFEAIRSEIVNDDPSEFTIDVELIANLDVNEDAPVFAIYTENALPDQCGDFRSLTLHYTKPSEYERAFDLTDHDDVMQAIESEGCVVIRNLPSKG